MAERAPEKREIPKEIEKKLPKWMALSHKSFEALNATTKAFLSKEDSTLYDLDRIVAYLKPGKPFDRKYVKGRLDSVAKALAAGSDPAAIDIDLKETAKIAMKDEMAAGRRQSVYKTWVEAVSYYKNFQAAQKNQPDAMSTAECEDWVVEIIALEQAYERYLQLFTEQRKDIGEETAPK